MMGAFVTLSIAWRTPYCFRSVFFPFFERGKVVLFNTPGYHTVIFAPNKFWTLVYRAV